MKITFAYSITFLLFGFAIFGQSQKKNLTNDLLNSTFEASTEKHKHRPALSIKNKKTIAKLNPLLYVGVGMMYFYQNVVSEQIQADCSYQISCSEYTKKCIEKKGFMFGTLEGFNQFFNCAPGVMFDRVPFLIDPNGKINNKLYVEN